MVGRGGFLLVEIAVAMLVLAAAGTAAVATVHAHALRARAAYEERVAREAASAHLERLEAARFRGLPEGARPLEVDLPGWENLEAARCELRVDAASDGARRVSVEVSWEGPRGIRRVRLQTLAEAAP